VNKYVVTILENIPGLANKKARKKFNINLDDGVTKSLTEVMDIFDGPRIMRVIAMDDWPLWVTELFGDSVVVIGGYLGVATRRVLERIHTVREIHTYEPVSEFAKQCEVNDPRATVFNEGVWIEAGPLLLQVNGDHTYTSGSGRIVSDELKKFDEYVAKSVTVETLHSRLSNKENYSIMMNCEGAEYGIIKQVLNLNQLPKSISFQTHSLKTDTLIQLYKVRFLLAQKGYSPILNLNYAWDIWVRI